MTFTKFNPEPPEDDEKQEQEEEKSYKAGYSAPIIDTTLPEISEEDQDEMPEHLKEAFAAGPDSFAEALGSMSAEDRAKSIAHLPPTFQAAIEQMLSIREQQEAHHRELYGDVQFDTGDNSLRRDLEAYDQAAYTRDEELLEAYRYNLGEGGAIASTGGTGTAAPAGGTGTAGYGGYGAYQDPYNGGFASSGYNWGYSGGSRSWMSSWYSGTGYSSAERALAGVHNHVCTFIRDTSFGDLEIVNDLGSPDDLLCKEQVDGVRFGAHVLTVRIDSSLYEKLGIEQAQQHYIVDCIAQSLAIQALPDPPLISLIQACNGEGEAFSRYFGYKVGLPNVVREIITEIMRARGVSLLTDEMPGWVRRVVAFREVMYVGKPPNTKIPAAFLMYAVWERDAVESLEHADAIKAIEAVEKILDKMKPFDPKQGVLSGSGKSYRTVRAKRVKTAVRQIDEILTDYVTLSGPIGRIISGLRNMRKSIIETFGLPDDPENDTLESFDFPIPDPPDSQFVDAIAKSCVEIERAVHDHNKTFIPDPSKPLDVRHLEHPDKTKQELLEADRQRVDLSRKCVFGLRAIPNDVIKAPDPDTSRNRVERCEQSAVLAIKRIDDILGEFRVRHDNASESEEYIADKYDNREGNNTQRRSGVNSTHHPELTMKRGIAHGGIDRNFTEQDPDFDRDVLIKDATLS